MTIVVQPPVSSVGQYWMGLFVVTLMEKCHSGTGDDPLAISWPSCLDYAQVIWDKSTKKNWTRRYLFLVSRSLGPLLSLTGKAVAFGCMKRSIFKQTIQDEWGITPTITASYDLWNGRIKEACRLC